MSQWDRKALLRLVEETSKRLDNPTLSTAQRCSLRALLDSYGDKAKSIDASQMDVLSMEYQISRILGTEYRQN